MKALNFVARTVLGVVLALSVACAPAAAQLTLMGVGYTAPASTSTSFVGVALYTNGSGTYALPGSPQAGDLVIVDAMNTSTHSLTISTNGGAGSFTAATDPGSTANCISSYFGYLEYRVLTSGDISTGTVAVTMQSTDPFIVMIYRGPTVVTTKQIITQSSGTTYTLNGFAPSGSSKGVVYTVMNGGTGGSRTITNSTGTWTARKSPGAVAFSGNPYWSGGDTDELTGYTNTNNALGGLNSSAFCGFMFEMT